MAFASSAPESSRPGRAPWSHSVWRATVPPRRTTRRSRRRISLAIAARRVRAVLRLLAVHAGNPVHREVLQTAFWPDADADTGARNLHVAVSSLRSWLEPGVGRGGSSLLLREGDAYRLTIQADAEVDLVQF